MYSRHSGSRCFRSHTRMNSAARQKDAHIAMYLTKNGEMPNPVIPLSPYDIPMDDFCFETLPSQARQHVSTLQMMALEVTLRPSYGFRASCVHDQDMSQIVLTRIDKSDGEVILVDDVARRTIRRDLAEDALGNHIPRLWGLSPSLSNGFLTTSCPSPPPLIPRITVKSTRIKTIFFEIRQLKFNPSSRRGPMKDKPGVIPA